MKEKKNGIMKQNRANLNNIAMWFENKCLPIMKKIAFSVNGKQWVRTGSGHSLDATTIKIESMCVRTECGETIG